MRNRSKGKVLTVHSGNMPIGHIIGTGDDLTDMLEADRVLHEAGVLKPQAPVAERMRRQAKGFADVAADLAIKIARLRGRSRDCVAPFLVNAAFSIELFLKALARHHGKELRGHRLLKLFEELPSAGRETVERSFSNAPPQLTDFEESDDLQGLFRNLDDAFEAWRYMYEGHHEGRPYGAKAALLLLAVMDHATQSVRRTSRHKPEGTPPNPP